MKRLLLLGALSFASSACVVEHRTTTIPSDVVRINALVQWDIDGHYDDYSACNAYGIKAWALDVVGRSYGEEYHPPDFDCANEHWDSANELAGIASDTYDITVQAVAPDNGLWGKAVTITADLGPGQEQVDVSFTDSDFP